MGVLARQKTIDEHNVTIANLCEAQNLSLGDWADVTSQLKSFEAQLVHDPQHRRALLQEGSTSATPIMDAPYPAERLSNNTPTQDLLCNLVNVLESTSKYPTLNRRISDVLDWKT